ncbi:hypothetical protein IQA83_16980 [Leptospira borgpetersenii serovar Ballum]|nr:hypothetical protein [Leptospira borgpetersenii serovar Ballum]
MIVTRALAARAFRASTQPADDTQGAPKGAARSAFSAPFSRQSPDRLSLLSS